MPGIEQQVSNLSKPVSTKWTVALIHTIALNCIICVRGKKYYLRIFVKKPHMFDGIFLRGLGGSNVSNSSCILCSSHLVRTSTLKFCVPSAMSAAYVSRFEFPPIIFYTMAHVVCYNCYFHPVTKKIKTPVTTYELGNRWCPFDYHKIVFPLNIMF